MKNEINERKELLAVLFAQPIRARNWPWDVWHIYALHI